MRVRYLESHAMDHPIEEVGAASLRCRLSGRCQRVACSLCREDTRSPCDKTGMRSRKSSRIG